MREITIPELDDLIDVQPLRKFWTEEDESIVREYYGKIPTVKLAEHLKRSRHAVESKANQLGVGFAKP